jgi:hypothetical protein
VRQSIAFARTQGTPPTPPPGSLLDPKHTVTDTAPARGAPIAVPGLGTVMSEPTATIDTRKRSHLEPLLVLLAATIASGVVAFVVVSALRHHPATGAHRDAPDGSAPGSGMHRPPDHADASHTAPPDAPGAPPDTSAGIPDAHAAIPVDLGPHDAPKPAAIAVQSPHAGATNHVGRLHVVGVPILTVTVDDEPFGESPRTIVLPVGVHRVRLQNAQNHIDVLLPAVLIRENETTTIDRMPR